MRDADQIADVVAERRRIGRQRAKDQIAEPVDAQLFEPVVFKAEACRHPALAGDAAAKGDAVEVAFEVVAPGVIDAGQIVGMPAPLQADEIAAMGAAVDHRMQRPVIAAGDDDRRLAEKGRQIVAGLGQFAGKRQKLPGRPEKDPGQLLAVDLRVGKHPVGDAGVALGGPLQCGLDCSIANLRSRFGGRRDCRASLAMTRGGVVIARSPRVRAGAARGQAPRRRSLVTSTRCTAGRCRAQPP